MKDKSSIDKMEFFYIYDVNTISYLLMNGITHVKVDRNPTTGKIRFYFNNTNELHIKLNEYKESPFKKFTTFQNQVKKVVHSN